MTAPSAPADDFDDFDVPPPPYEDVASPDRSPASAEAGSFEEHLLPSKSQPAKSTTSMPGGGGVGAHAMSPQQRHAHVSAEPALASTYTHSYIVMPPRGHEFDSPSPSSSASPSPSPAMAMPTSTQYGAMQLTTNSWDVPTEAPLQLQRMGAGAEYTEVVTGARERYRVMMAAQVNRNVKIFFLSLIGAFAIIVGLTVPPLDLFPLGLVGILLPILCMFCSGVKLKKTQKEFISWIEAKCAEVNARPHIQGRLQFAFSVVNVSVPSGTRSKREECGVITVSTV